MEILKLILYAIEKKINKIFVHNKKYKIGTCQISIPSTSNLINYQKKYPLYDRFLPVLAAHLKSGIVIDVGANIGDTVVAMAQNCSNSFICVEPLEYFYNYLQKNVTKIQQKEGQQIKLIKEMISCGNLLGELIGDGSTAHFKINDKQSINEKNNQTNHVKLDHIVDDYSNIVLIKSDVDGYDFDVIRSAEKILSESEPILFWENVISDDFQYEEYNKLYDFLEEKGYSHLYIFDNFGNLLVENSNFKILKDINTYLYNMTKYNATRTFFYTDILASTEKRKLTIETAVADYKYNYIKVKK